MPWLLQVTRDGNVAFVMHGSDKVREAIQSYVTQKNSAAVGRLTADNAFGISLLERLLVKKEVSHTWGTLASQKVGRMGQDLGL